MATLSPEDFAVRARAFQESRILLSAIELDVFAAVGGGARAGEVAARLGTDERATAMLLNAVVAAGALEKSGDLFRNTAELAPLLIAGSPEYIRPGMMHTVNLWRTWSTLTEAVREGTAISRPGVEARDPQWTEDFIAAMHQNAARTAIRLVEIAGVEDARRMLDIGGGSGAYAIAFAQASPDLNADVFDIAQVVPIASRHIDAAGLSDRVHTRTGDLRVDRFGSGYDLILLSSICHMLGVDENRDLLRRCAEASARDGRIIIRDFMLNDDRTSPKQAALFAINMLVGTAGGDSYSWREYSSWLSEAGYTVVQKHDGEPNLIVGRKS